MGWTRATVLKVAKRTGYPVVESWSGHNAGTMGTVVGPILHHTATPESVPGDYPTLRVVRDGRPGLENSLAMYGIGRSGTIYCINEKISWHAGVGDWNGLTDGNGYFAGIEAEGPYSTWPAKELDAYERLVASILIETGRGQAWAPTHAQWANPPGRKSDPYGFDLAAFRRDVDKYLANPSLLGGGEVDMPLTTEEIEKIAQRTRQVVADSSLAYGLDRLRMRFDSLDTTLKSLDNRVRHIEQITGDHAVSDAKREPVSVDVKALAAELAALDLDTDTDQLAELVVTKLQERLAE